MAQLGIHLQRRGKVEALAWPRIEPLRDGVQLALGVPRQIRALRQVLAQEAIGVFVTPTLPGAMRIGKEHLERETLSQPLMLRHLFAPIIGQRFPQWGGHRPKLLREALVRTRGIRAVHAGQEDQARGPFHQRADGRAVARSLEEVPFPVPRDGPIGHRSRPGGNGGHVGQLPASIGAPRPRPTSLPRLPQRGQQLGPQIAPWQHIQRGIDRLGREAFAHVVRIRASEPPGNLLGRAALSQVGPDILPQPGIQECAPPPGLACSAGRLGVRGAGTIGMAACRVAGIFTAQRAGGPAQQSCQPPQRLPLGQAQTDGFTFVGAQVRILSLCHGNTLAHQGGQCCTWN